MPVIEQEGDAVFLRSDRIRLGQVYGLQVLDAELVAQRGARVGTHHAGDDEGGFLRQMVRQRELLRRYVVLEHHALQHAGAIAELQEVQLAAGAPVVEPALERDLFIVVLADVFNVDPSHECALEYGSRVHETAPGALWVAAPARAPTFPRPWAFVSPADPR